MNYYDYSIIRYMPDSRRGEFVNIGIVIYKHHHVETHLLSNLAKARHLDTSLSINDLENLPSLFNSIVANVDTANEMFVMLENMGPIKLSQLAYFAANTQQEYDDQIRGIMRDLINPKAKAIADKSHGKLITAIKKQFQQHNLLAAPDEDITRNHLVAIGYQLTDESGLTVDFAQKNGKWHVTQAIDYKIQKDYLPKKFKEVGIKSIGFDQATKYLGADTSKICIIDLPDEYQSVVQGQINLLSEYADHVLYYSSKEDMDFFWRQSIEIGFAS